MRRRDFITLIGGVAAAWPLAAWAQQPEHLRRIGVLMSGAESDPEAKLWFSTFVQGLASLGWTVSHNVQVDTRWAAGDPNRLKALATELVDLRPDVIVATGTVTLLAVRQETHSVPIVFAQVNDPVGSGLVASLAHPGDNITGFTNFEYAIAGKWLELLRQMTSRIGRVAVIMNPENSGHPGFVRAVENAAKPSAIQVTTARVRNAGDIESIMNAFAPGPDAGLIVLPDQCPSRLDHQSGRSVPIARDLSVPIFATDGGLIAYGIDGVDLYRHVASYVDRILKGAKPGDLPIQQPAKFEMVINLTTAKALGLTIPPAVLSIADELIE
jgi:putative tryptophan/tyrosine transport system substrate-binding protein